MADVIKTIMPLGGGDYTTLQAFENDAESMSTALNRWVAECYSGGSMGSANFVGWTIEDTRVYGADGHRPTGAFIPAGETVARLDTAGTTTLDIQIQNVEIDGIQIDCGGTRSNVRIRGSGGGCLMKNFIGKHDGPGDVSFAQGIWSQVLTAGVMPRIYNAYLDASLATAHRTVIGDRGSGGIGFDELVNCTFIPKAATPAVNFTGAGSLVNFMGNVYGTNWQNTGKITSADGCASADTTAPGTNTVHNVVEANAFVNIGSQNVDLKAGSVLINAGQDMSSIPEVTTDIAGKPRPIDGLWDIGPSEFGDVPSAETGLIQNLIQDFSSDLVRDLI